MLYDKSQLVHVKSQCCCLLACLHRDCHGNVSLLSQQAGGATRMLYGGYYATGFMLILIPNRGVDIEQLYVTIPPMATPRQQDAVGTD